MAERPDPRLAADPVLPPSSQIHWRVYGIPLLQRGRRNNDRTSDTEPQANANMQNSWRFPDIFKISAKGG
jgi:hypothetical protein